MCVECGCLCAHMHACMCVCARSRPYVSQLRKGWIDRWTDGCIRACSRCPACRWIVGSRVRIKDGTPEPNELLAGGPGGQAGSGWVEGWPVAQALLWNLATTHPGPDVGLAWGCGPRTKERWGFGMGTALGMEMGEGTVTDWGRALAPAPAPALEPRPRGQSGTD